MKFLSKATHPSFELGDSNETLVNKSSLESRLEEGAPFEYEVHHELDSVSAAREGVIYLVPHPTVANEHEAWIKYVTSPVDTGTWQKLGYVDLSIATTSKAGLMSSSDKTKLNGIAAGAQVNEVSASDLSTHANTTSGVHGIPTNAKFTDTTYGAATTSSSGLMSAADKTKLNGIAAGAQVNPGAATTSAAGLMSAADKTKLNGIAAGAQVNPTNISAFTNNVGYQTAAQVTAAINSNIIGSGNASGVVFNQNLVDNSIYILYIGRDTSMYVASTSSGGVRLLAIAPMENAGSISSTGGLNLKIDFSTRARPWILTKVL